MDITFWILGVVWVFVSIFVAVLLVYKTNRPQRIDWRALFYLGVAWVPLGLIVGVKTFWVMGAMFLVAGAINKAKWPEQKAWIDMSIEEKISKSLMLLFLAALLVMGLVAPIVRKIF